MLILVDILSRMPPFCFLHDMFPSKSPVPRMVPLPPLYLIIFTRCSITICACQCHHSWHQFVGTTQDPARKIVVASGALTSREMRRIQEVRRLCRFPSLFLNILDLPPTKKRFSTGFPTKKCSNPGGDCYCTGGRSKQYLLPLVFYCI